MKRDYYEILGVDKNADESTIKKAYRKVAMQFHPDRNPGDKAAEEKFKEAAEAYEVLSDADLKRKYDMFGERGIGTSAASDSQASSPFGGSGGFGQEVDLGDIFDSFFGGAEAEAAGVVLEPVPAHADRWSGMTCASISKLISKQPCSVEKKRSVFGT